MKLELRARNGGRAMPIPVHRDDVDLVFVVGVDLDRDGDLDVAFTP